MRQKAGTVPVGGGFQQLIQPCQLVFTGSAAKVKVQTDDVAGVFFLGMLLSAAENVQAVFLQKEAEKTVVKHGICTVEMLSDSQIYFIKCSCADLFYLNSKPADVNAPLSFSSCFFLHCMSNL